MTFAFSRTAIACAAGAALALGFSPGAEASDYYNGKVIKIIVGYGPGGGYDTYARLLAPKLEKETGATVVVENHPGGGGLLALNQLVKAKGDGLSMMLVNGSAAALGQITRRPGVRFQLAKLKYLARVSSSPWLWMVGKNYPNKTVESIKASGKTLKWSASGKTDGISDGAAATCEALQLKCKITIGYKGSKGSALAVIQGEADALFVSDTSAAHYAQGGEMVPVAVMGHEKSVFFPNVKPIFDIVKLTPKEAWWIDFKANIERLGRVMVAPPKTGKAHVKELRAAFKNILTDEAFVKAMAKKKRYIDFLDAKDAAKLAHDVTSGLDKDQIEKVNDVLLKKYF